MTTITNKRRASSAEPTHDWPFPPLIEALFVERPNRFLIRARLGRRVVEAASRDPGRLAELLRPGAVVLLSPAATLTSPGTVPEAVDVTRRRTRYTLTLVRHGSVWVSVVPALANRILEAALRRSGVPGLSGARVLKREVRVGESRLDFLLRRRGADILTEVKSATLVEAGRALFPDAPTARGTRHLRQLAVAAKTGRAAQVIFLIQRPDAVCLSPHRQRDPEFGQALDEAARAGVTLRAYTCRVSPEGCSLDQPIRIVL